MEVSDLYHIRFNPVFKAEDYSNRVDPLPFSPCTEALHAAETSSFSPDILAEMEKLQRADLLIFPFPPWFYSWPSIMRG